MPWWQRAVSRHAAKVTADPRTLAGTAFLGDGRNSILERAPAYLSVPAWLDAEVPASNGVTTAGSLAKLFASVTAEALPPVIRGLATPKVAATYGFVANASARTRRVLGPNRETFSSGGFGGQLVLADPVAQISLASTCTDFTPRLSKLFPQVRDSVYNAAGTLALVYLILRSRRGLALGAIRDHEAAAAGLGVDIYRIKLAVYVATAAMTGMIGALIYLQKARISPDAAFLDVSTSSGLLVGVPVKAR